MLKKSLYLSVVLGLLPLPSWAFTNSIGMEFVGIPSGSFLMGTQAPSCPQDDPFTAKNEAADCQGSVSSSETPRHQVAVDGFYMAATEVTQAQWVAVMGSNPSGFKSEDVGGDSRNHPVERVSWDDAQAFISRLNKMEGTNKYRLPSEAEWEYAARGGTQSEYSCGNSESCLDGIAWYGSSWVKTHPVGQKQPNRFGLYDPRVTSGNGLRIAGIQTTVVRLPMVVRGRVVIVDTAWFGAVVMMSAVSTPVVRRIVTTTRLTPVTTAADSAC